LDKPQFNKIKAELRQLKTKDMETTRFQSGFRLQSEATSEPVQFCGMPVIGRFETTSQTVRCMSAANPGPGAVAGVPSAR
jgi:hypothetical protein